MDRIQTDTHLNTGIYGAYMCDARLSYTATAYASAGHNALFSPMVFS